MKQPKLYVPPPNLPLVSKWIGFNKLVFFRGVPLYGFKIKLKDA
jgi:hypothetical protein